MSFLNFEKKTLNYHTFITLKLNPNLNMRMNPIFFFLQENEPKLIALKLTPNLNMRMTTINNIKLILIL
jgi:hypothetical protein